MNLDLITAVLLALAGFSMGLREIVLSPALASFPKAPLIVRAAMFAYAASMAWGAMVFAGAAWAPGDYAGPAAGVMAAIAGGLAAYNVVMICNLYAQRYPPKVWHRLNRLSDTVRESCPDPALSVRRRRAF